LFAIAEAAGGDWPGGVQEAFGHLNDDEDDEAIGPMVLADIRDAFSSCERMHSADLVAYLVALEERPWSEWRHGKPLTTTGLSRLLKPFRIKSKQLWIAGTNLHGYERKDFTDVFARYLPPETGADSEPEGIL
jgi:hypothetical protein